MTAALAAMPTPRTPDTPPAKAAKRPRAKPRGRGRPVSGRIDVQGEGMSRALILARALQLARSQPLDDVSMAVLAKDLGVTPALIYYYIVDRDTLISGVANLFFQALVGSLPAPIGAWRSDLEALAHALQAHDQRYFGVATYLARHNRFRLFQRVGPGETDHGLAFFDHVARIFMNGGFGAEQSALGYHLVVQHVVASGAAQARHQLPADHKDYIRGKLMAASAEQYPGAHFLATAFPELSAERAFETGLKLLLDGIQTWRD